MGNYIGGLSGIEQPLTQWENLWGTAEENRQRRWLNNETRTAVDRENRYQRDLSQAEVDAQARRAGLFESMDAQFSGMGRRNVPNATPTAPGANAVGGTGPASLVPSSAPAQATTPAPVSAPTQAGIMTPNASERWEVVTSSAQLTPEQRNALNEYVTANYSGIGSSARRDYTHRRLLEVGLNIDANGNPIRRVTNNANLSLDSLPERFDIQNYGDSNLPLADPQADLSSGTSTGTSTQTTAGVTEGSNDEYYRGDPDTSAALAATPEMRMLEETVQSELDRARVAARYGRSEQAQVHFANALQGQAAYLQQSRLVMLRASMQGHRTALADLLGLYSGRPEGTTRLAPAGDRFHIEVLNNEGQWVSATSNPLTQQQLVERAEYLVDRESVLARSEANSEIIRANIAAGADIAVAQIGAATAQQRMLVDAAIAQMEADERRRVAQGNAEFVVDSTNNRAYLQWWETGPDGNPVQIVREISEQDVRVADSDRRRTERRMVGRNVEGVGARVTGTVGVN